MLSPSLPSDELLARLHESPPLVVAQFYRALGWIPLPIRSPPEIDAYVEGVVAEWHLKHPEATEDELEVRRKRTADRASKATFEKWRGGVRVASPPTDDELIKWWGPYPERPIYLLTGPGTGLCVVDVDTYKGGEPEPWASLATIIVRTRRGGLHCYFAEASAKTDNDQVAPGVDIRGTGGGVAAPSGTATPGRYFERWAFPLAALPVEQLAAASRTVAAAAATSPASAPGTRARPGPGPGRVGSFAEVVRGPCRDGTRTAAAKMIVGMLCRAAPLPADAVDAALGLLAEWLAATPAAVAAMRPAWEAVLASPSPRPEAFVVQFVSLWAQLRCDPAWDPDAGGAGTVASSLWRTAAAHAAPPPPPDEVAGVGDTSLSDEERTLLYYAPAAADVWGPEGVEEDQHREILSCASLPAWLGPDGRDPTDSEFGHGWGPWLDRAIGGGIAPGLMILLGAKRAKGGKTAIVDGWLTGLQMLGAAAYQGLVEAPVLQIWVITEMPPRGLEWRGASRYLGCDQGLYRAGRRAGYVPGVEELAERTGESAGAIATRLFERTRACMSDDSLWAFARRRLRRYVDVSRLPPERRRGPDLIATVCSLIDIERERLAQETRRPLSQVWPVLLLDPYQRSESRRAGEDGVQSSGEILEALRYAVDGGRDDGGRESADRRLVAFVTTDTNKATAASLDALDKLPPDAAVARAARGTYGAIHIPDVALALDVAPLTAVERRMQRQEGRELERRASILVGVTRWSEGSDDPIPFRYFPRSGRFVPIQPPTPPPLRSTAPPPAGPLQPMPTPPEGVAPDAVVRLSVGPPGPQPRANRGRFGAKKKKDEGGDAKEPEKT